MTAGVGVFGAIAAAMATWFLAPEEQETESEIAALRREITSLREAVERMQRPS